MDNDAYIKANDEQQSSLDSFSQDGGADTEADEPCWCEDKDLACWDCFQEAIYGRA